MEHYYDSTLKKMVMTCDPCQFCQNIYDDSDPSVGLYGAGCTAADNGAEEDELFDPFVLERPCRHFVPRLPSDDLYEQLYREDQEREFSEFLKELHEHYENKE